MIFSIQLYHKNAFCKRLYDIFRQPSTAAAKKGRRRRAVLAEKHAGVALRGHGVSVVAPERHDRAVRVGA